MKIVLTALLTLATLGLTGPLMAFEPDKNDALQLDVARAIVNIRKADPGIETFFEQAAGYAVFPSIGKGGVIVGLADEFGLPIRHVGVGEAVEDLRDFSAEEFVEALFEEKEPA